MLDAAVAVYTKPHGLLQFTVYARYWLNSVYRLVHRMRLTEVVGM